jgi:plastocyanin
MISLVKTTVALAALGIAVSGVRAPVAHTVKLQGNAFVPAEVQASAGDTLTFVNGNGGPHNVEFVKDSVAEPARKLFEAAMPGGKYKLGPMSGPLLIDTDEKYRMVVPSVPAGRYAFLCLPHQVNMKGALIVTK